MFLHITAFEWDEGNEPKIFRKHKVARHEVEEVFFNAPLVRKAAQKRYLAFGQTDNGRYLFVVFVRKPKGLIRPISARDMDSSERTSYRRKRYG